MVKLATFICSFLLICTIVAQPGTVTASHSIEYTRYLDFVYDSSDFSPNKEGYDYIIVGGGTAGCPLATTLSQNYTVLVLERGGSSHADPNVLYQNRSALNLRQTNGKDSPAETFKSVEGVPNARGRVLGGSSMITFPYYSRGDEEFFENSGIDWDMGAVMEAYEWVEDAIISRLSGSGEWQSAVVEAMVQSGVFGVNNGYTLDHVLGVKSSGSIFDENGRRHGAVELLNQGNPNNLMVVLNATVERITLSNDPKGGLSSTGVIYRDRFGNSHEVRLRSKGEVILSAGAIGSPQLLLLSGIGPQEALSSVSIPIQYNQPFVGGSMVDIPRNRIGILSPFAVKDVGSPVYGIANDFFVIPVTSNSSFLVVDVKVKKALSFGSLSLASPTNASVNPMVGFRYYSNPNDVHHCMNGIRAIAKIMYTPNSTALDMFKFSDGSGAEDFKFVGTSFPQNMSDDGSVEAYCRETIITYFNFFGGCTVGQVVDHDFRVVGINYLRVVDGSTFNSCPGTGPLATILMLGRYVGLKMIKDRIA